MAFTVEQGVKHSAIEHDPFKKSFLTAISPLTKDVTVQTSECFVLSAALDPSNKLMTSSPFAYEGRYEQQVQGMQDGKYAAGGASTPDVAPCTPCPSFVQQKSQGQKLAKKAHTFPSLCLGIGLLEGQQVPCIQKLTTPKKPRSSKEFLQQLSTSSPQSIFITPIQRKEARSELQKETVKPFKEVLISSKLCKHEQYLQEYEVSYSAVSLSNFTEVPSLQKSPANPRNSKFSFLEALTAGDTQFAQEMDFTPCIRPPLPEEVGCLQSSAEGPNHFESSFNKLLDQSKSLTPTCEKNLHWEFSQQTNPGAFVSNSDALVEPQACISNAVCTVSCSSPVKQEWSKTLKQFPRLYQALSQEKNVAISVCHERKSPEKRRKLLLSPESNESGASDNWSELNGISSGLPYTSAARHVSQNFEQLNARDALDATSSRKMNGWHGQPSENFFRPVSLAKVKVEIDFEESYGGRNTCGDSVEENEEISRCNAKALTEMGFLDSSSAGTYAPPKCSLMDTAETCQQAGLNLSVCAQLPQVLSTVSAGGPSVCFHNEQSRKSMDLEEQTPPMNRTSQIDGCWGKFLALSASTGQHRMKGDTEIFLPFQHRFKQLQEFLKQCDTSEKYSLQAFQSLTAAAMNASAVELETRAVWLSLEEGKELKRMKMLNVLGKASEGFQASSGGRAVYGPWLPTPGNGMQVKQEI